MQGGQIVRRGDQRATDAAPRRKENALNGAVTLRFRRLTPHRDPRDTFPRSFTRGLQRCPGKLFSRSSHLGEMTMSNVVQPHNLKSQTVWNSPAGRYDDIS